MKSAEPEIEVSPEMIEAGIYAANTLLDKPSYIAHIYRAMRRVELSRAHLIDRLIEKGVVRKEPTP
jgi:hypothetical protein